MTTARRMSSAGWLSRVGLIVLAGLWWAGASPAARGGDPCFIEVPGSGFYWVNPCDEDCDFMERNCDLWCQQAEPDFYCSPQSGTPTAGYCWCVPG